ncbi:hypothetical protein [Ruegeria arenilitoris]|uniref:hypothetical protein n=1 Tax=Ruegeria arenilitoris TaxID=1173585 RepID=UPI00147A04EB|nr:hypothetical protein [Ruegeria arenilitoris]
MQVEHEKGRSKLCIVNTFHQINEQLPFQPHHWEIMGQVGGRLPKTRAFIDSERIYSAFGGVVGQILGKRENFWEIMGAIKVGIYCVSSAFKV